MIQKLIATLVLLVLVDVAYISMVYKMFETTIINVQKTSLQIRPLPTVACYLLLGFGLWYLIIRRSRPLEEAFVFGLTVYGVYAMTNYATIKNWSPYMAAADTMWGGTLFSIVTLLISYI